jgi:hypothetical protein
MFPHTAHVESMAVFDFVGVRAAATAPPMPPPEPGLDAQELPA